MLIRNDVLLYAGPSSRAVRILWVDPGRTMTATFALGTSGAWPVAMALQVLAADVQNRRARLLLRDPYAARPPAATPTPAQLAAHERAGAVIDALMASNTAVFNAQERRRIVAQAAAANGLSAATVHRYLRRYWEGGQTPDALWPEETSPPCASVQAAPETRRTFRMAVTRYASTHSAFSRRAAYRQMLEDFYPERTIAALPTFGQFNYWIDKDAVLSSIK